MRTVRDVVSTLKDRLAGLDSGAGPRTTDSAPLGVAGLDGPLGGGLARGVLHEVYPADEGEPMAAAGGFGLGLALRAGRDLPLVWIRHDTVSARIGGLDGAGLAAFGADPRRLVLVRVPDQAGGLRAARDALRCPALGAVLVELWGGSRALDLTATRRLALAAAGSGVTLVMVRLGASPEPSAATTRWSAAAAASSRLEANAPGRPAFGVTLLRHRAGPSGRTWHLEWDRDRACFAEPAPPPRAVVPVPARRKGAADPAAGWRRAV